jgi:hypothetical protein
MSRKSIEPMELGGVVVEVRWASQVRWIAEPAGDATSVADDQVGHQEG